MLFGILAYHVILNQGRIRLGTIGSTPFLAGADAGSNLQLRKPPPSTGSQVGKEFYLILQPGRAITWRIMGLSK